MRGNRQLPSLLLLTIFCIDGITMSIAESYPNCPKYIQQRQVVKLNENAAAANAKMELRAGKIVTRRTRKRERLRQKDKRQRRTQRRRYIGD